MREIANETEYLSARIEVFYEMDISSPFYFLVTDSRKNIKILNFENAKAKILKENTRGLILEKHTPYLSTYKITMLDFLK